MLIALAMAWLTSGAPAKPRKKQSGQQKKRIAACSAIFGPYNGDDCTPAMAFTAKAHIVTHRTNVVGWASCWPSHAFPWAVRCLEPVTGVTTGASFIQQLACFCWWAVAIFLYFAHTGPSSPMLQERFQRSGDTISKRVIFFLANSALQVYKKIS